MLELNQCLELRDIDILNNEINLRYQLLREMQVTDGLRLSSVYDEIDQLKIQIKNIIETGSQLKVVHLNDIKHLEINYIDYNHNTDILKLHGIAKDSFLKIPELGWRIIINNIKYKIIYIEQNFDEVHGVFVMVYNIYVGGPMTSKKDSICL